MKRNKTFGTVCPSTYIMMDYKEQCKSEGEVLTRVKITRAVLSGLTQKEVAKQWRCNKNTVSAIMKIYNKLPERQKELIKQKSLSSSDLAEFKTFKHLSRRPHGNKRTLSAEQEKIIISKHKTTHYGPKRMHTHLKRQGYNMNIFTLSKIKGCYKRNKLKGKKTRSYNGERRPLYNYDKIGAFEYLQYDVKHITDKHALPKDIYDKFSLKKDLPIYQWTVQDAKTRARFLAYSHNLSSFFGQRFLFFVVSWLRAHSVFTQVNVQFDGGSEFCSASEQKLKVWQEFFAPFGVKVDHTRGDKKKQNLVERSHRSDDEEFYCPRGEYIETKTDFLLEAQKWNIYWNCERPHSGIDDLTPSEKLEKLGFANARALCSFPSFILEDIHKELFDLPDLLKGVCSTYPQNVSQNVFDYYKTLFACT